MDPTCLLLHDNATVSIFQPCFFFFLFLQCLLLGSVRLLVLEWEPACALIELVILANHGLVASKHDAVQSKDRKGGASKTSQEEARLASPSISAIAVEGADGMVKGCDYDGCVGERGYGIFGG